MPAVFIEIVIYLLYTCDCVDYRRYGFATCRGIAARSAATAYRRYLKSVDKLPEDAAFLCHRFHKFVEEIVGDKPICKGVFLRICNYRLHKVGVFENIDYVSH